MLPIVVVDECSVGGSGSAIVVWEEGMGPTLLFFPPAGIVLVVMGSSFLPLAAVGASWSGDGWWECGVAVEEAFGTGTNGNITQWRVVEGRMGTPHNKDTAAKIDG